jgi:predicted peptidase
MANKKLYFVISLAIFTTLLIFLSTQRPLTATDHRNAVLNSSTQRTGQIIEKENYLLFLPENFSDNITMPLIVALPPDADADSMISLWKPIADRHGWIIMASKVSRNGLNETWIMQTVLSDIAGIENTYHIDRSKIIFTGYSGGGMGAHAFAYNYPDTSWAIIVNTGMINVEYLNRTDYPRNKIVVFLASPTDFRFEEMNRDRYFLEDLGWETKWIEFQGGHMLAPESAYEEAADWLVGLKN